MDNKKHPLVSLCDDLFDVAIARKVLREGQAEDLCKAHSFQLQRAQTDGVEGLLGLREVSYDLFAFVTIKDQFVFPGPFFYLLDFVLDEYEI